MIEIDKRIIFSEYTYNYKKVKYKKLRILRCDKIKNTLQDCIKNKKEQVIKIGGIISYYKALKLNAKDESMIMTIWLSLHLNEVA